MKSCKVHTVLYSWEAFAVASAALNVLDSIYKGFFACDLEEIKFDREMMAQFINQYKQAICKKAKQILKEATDIQVQNYVDFFKTAIQGNASSDEMKWIAKCFKTQWERFFRCAWDPFKTALMKHRRERLNELSCELIDLMADIDEAFAVLDSKGLPLSAEEKQQLKAPRKALREKSNAKTLELINSMIDYFQMMFI